jgi:hypothetical protein
MIDPIAQNICNICVAGAYRAKDSSQLGVSDIIVGSTLWALTLNLIGTISAQYAGALAIKIPHGIPSRICDAKNIPWLLPK